MALTWDDLWQRRDQQADAALGRGEHERVLDLAEQPQQRGTASYRLGDYEAAADAFGGIDRADGHYNYGNALARSGRLEEAITAYERALAKEPGMEDAAYNKTLIEELLKQQQEQQEQQQSQDDDEQGQQGDQSNEQQAPDQSQGDQPQQGEQGGAEEQQDAGAKQKGESDQEPQSGEQGQESGEGEDHEAAQAPEQGGESADAPREQSADRGSDAESEQSADLSEDEDRQETEQAAADYREEASQHQDTKSEATPAAVPGEPSAEEREAQQAANQWLRRIPDDPAGLLRRKFLYQYRSRAVREGAVTSGDPW
jgi:Ca-activated chloride channel family protein